jgi:hypothetical protein
MLIAIINFDSCESEKNKKAFFRKEKHLLRIVWTDEIEEKVVGGLGVGCIGEKLNAAEIETDCEYRIYWKLRVMDGMKGGYLQPQQFV